MDDELALAEFLEVLIACLLLDRLSPFSELVKAASSIILLVLEVFLGPLDNLVLFSEFILDDDV